MKSAHSRVHWWTCNIQHRTIAWVVVWSTVAVQVALYAWPTLPLIPLLCVSLVAGFITDACVTRAILRHAWAVTVHRRRYHAPLVLDEDGYIRSALMLPGDNIAIVPGPHGPIAGCIVNTRTGKVRSETNWGAR